ncbi:class I SAM-dependent methyltransferase [Streptomyces sp. NPDC059070]|uniref:class I SAM-dependent methyltransferase n=1 Tax=Streptomyces sp. NPDC059070 TaxID=3346713 RepID=UPI00368E8514
MRSADAESFDAVYRGGGVFSLPPWDIGEPQPEFVRLMEAGEIKGRVLDAGCGTGSLALYLAKRGLDVVALDFSPTAVQLGRRKAAGRQLPVVFEVSDLSAVGGHEAEFDTLLDCALLHALEEPERGRYMRELWRMARPGGIAHVLTFSDELPDFVEVVKGVGPHRATGEELLREMAEAGWRVRSLERSTIIGQIAVKEMARALEAEVTTRIELPAWLAMAQRPW